MSMTMTTMLAVLIPLLPLVAALAVLVGEPETQDQRARLGVWPLVASFAFSSLLLVLVASQGAVTIRFYDPASIANLALPLGFHVDRLSAVMMVLISLVGTIIYRYSVTYMYQDRIHHVRPPLHGLQRESRDAVPVLAALELSAGAARA
jgi:NADH-quinone oxidoreductase subunit L